MNKELFIYGAAVQGIQSFIFRTNELKDIVGASELVERICTTLFEEAFLQGGEALVNAAGNIKCVYSCKEECEKTVRAFPKTVMLEAPGITISQAVVKTTETELKNNFRSIMCRLEENLHAQRNKQAKTMTIGLMAMERSRKTGMPAVVCLNNSEYIDEATLKKRELSIGAKATIKLCEKSFGQKNLSPRNIALNISDLTDKNDWIAVIHADGNGLGEVVQRMSATKEGLKYFSQKLDMSTQKAAQEAFKVICPPEDHGQESGTLKFRPIVLGGDDLTMICKASLALPYVEAYLEKFEEETEKNLGSGNGLTACAGIAYIKSSYPFHYGYKLAEILCSQAKKISKSPDVMKGASCAPSSVLSYKVQSSFIENYDRLIEKEKTPREGIQLCAGPYFLYSMENFWTIKQLEDVVSKMSCKDGNVVKTAIRKWMTLMHQDTEMAKQNSQRSEQILPDNLKDVFRAATTAQQRLGVQTDFYPAGDVIDLFTIQNQKTRED